MKHYNFSDKLLLWYPSTSNNTKKSNFVWEIFYKYLYNILNAKNLAPPFLSIFFWNKIDDFKNQCSLVFMPVQLTIVVEKIKCE